MDNENPRTMGNQGMVVTNFSLKTKKNHLHSCFQLIYLHLKTDHKKSLTHTNPYFSDNLIKNVPKSVILKGTVSRDFLPSFFRQSIIPRPQINTLKYFRILFRNRRDIRP
jgi:hypothetical protein